MLAVGKNDKISPMTKRPAPLGTRHKAGYGKVSLDSAVIGHFDPQLHRRLQAVRSSGRFGRNKEQGLFMAGSGRERPSDLITNAGRGGKIKRGETAVCLYRQFLFRPKSRTSFWSEKLKFKNVGQLTNRPKRPKMGVFLLFGSKKSVFALK